MFALLSSRLRTWLFFAVALPILRRVARGTADRLERRHGSPTRTTKVLHRASDLGRKRR